MNRFSYRKRSLAAPRLVLSISVFLLILLLFVQGISSISQGTRKRQKEALKNALMNSITSCYAIEGFYPENLEYLKTQYGLTYDEELFFVDYRASARNLYPDVTVIERKEGRR